MQDVEILIHIKNLPSTTNVDDDHHHLYLYLLFIHKQEGKLRNEHIIFSSVLDDDTSFFIRLDSRA